MQCVGSTCTPFRIRFNYYRACSRGLNSGASLPQVEFFRHFIEEGYHVLLKDLSIKIIDQLTDGNRTWKSFWKHQLDCFAPKGEISWHIDA